VPTRSTGSSSPARPTDGSVGVPERPAEVAEALRRLGVRPARELGQSFLTDRFVADALAALAEPASGGPFFEIGGGLGLVTRALLDRGVRGLTVVERDRRLADHLARTFGDRLTVRCEDARAFPFPPGSTVVGSLPFASGTEIVLGLFRARVRRLAVILQKEVAERFAASPPGRAYGRPSIVARLYGEGELYREVPPEAFEPRPKVASRLFVHVARAGALPVPSVDRLESVVRTLFGSRRKQLGNLLPQLADGPDDANRLAREAGWPDGWDRQRPEELPPESFFRLATVLDRRYSTSRESVIRERALRGSEPG
jgi:16S rRNA (adenine1518-N6/adenine1519-N6)-dimethyltransferase